jgi:membrane-associated phospholipid phosphatase
VGLIVTYVASIRLVGGIFESFYSSELSTLQTALLAVSSLLFYVLLFLLFTRFKQENLVKLRDISLIMMLVSAFSFVSVTGIKYIMGRASFRILDENYSEFSNFLTMNFLRGLEGDGYRSFPSGHTGSATCLLTLFLVPMKLCNKKWVSYLVLGASFVYAVVVALSRIMIGAHYASDVLFGFGCSVVSFAIIYFVFYKKGWLNARGN